MNFLTTIARRQVGCAALLAAGIAASAGSRPAETDWIQHHFRSIEYNRNATEDLSDLMLDVNGDGYPDVVSSASHGNRIWWNENPGAKGGDGKST